jgi:hypothetical protein
VCSSDLSAPKSLIPPLSSCQKLKDVIESPDSSDDPIGTELAKAPALCWSQRIQWTGFWQKPDAKNVELGMALEISTGQGVWPPLSF